MRAFQEINGYKARFLERKIVLLNENTIWGLKCDRTYHMALVTNASLAPTCPLCTMLGFCARFLERKIVLLNENTIFGLKCDRTYYPVTRYEC